MRFGLIAKVLLGMLWLAPLAAQAQDDDAEDSGRLTAVQHRKFREAYELQVAFASLPLDAFYKTVGVEAGFTWHITDRIGWEIIHGGYAYDIDSGLTQQLKSDFNVAPTFFDEAKWYANSDIVLKPFYTKASLFNRAVVHGEAFLMAGIGAFGMTKGVDPALNAGIGGRVYLSPHISLRVDGRYSLVSLNGVSNLKNILSFSVGPSFDFGGD